MNARISSGEKWQVAILTTVQHVDSKIETPFGIEAGENRWWKEKLPKLNPSPNMSRDLIRQMINAIFLAVRLPQTMI